MGGWSRRKVSLPAAEIEPARNKRRLGLVKAKDKREQSVFSMRREKAADKDMRGREPTQAVASLPEAGIAAEGSTDRTQARYG